MGRGDGGLQEPPEQGEERALEKNTEEKNLYLPIYLIFKK